MKAIVNREVAERQLADEELQASIDRQLRSLAGGAKPEATAGTAPKSGLAELDSKIDKVYDSVVMQFKNYNVKTEAILEEIQ